VKASDVAFEIIVGALIAAVIFMLVRPGSPAADAVNQVSSALSALVATATQYQYGGSSGP
jgi:hypothetical protein